MCIGVRTNIQILFYLILCVVCTLFFFYVYFNYSILIIFVLVVNELLHSIPGFMHLNLFFTIIMKEFALVFCV